MVVTEPFQQDVSRTDDRARSRLDTYRPAALFSTPFAPISEGEHRVKVGGARCNRLISLRQLHSMIERLPWAICSFRAHIREQKGPAQPQVHFWLVILVAWTVTSLHGVGVVPYRRGGKQTPVPTARAGERCALPIFRLAVAAHCRMRWYEGCWAPRWPVSSE
jgi:hypothetical protein